MPTTPQSFQTENFAEWGIWSYFFIITLLAEGTLEPELV